MQRRTLSHQLAMAISGLDNSTGSTPGTASAAAPALPLRSPSQSLTAPTATKQRSAPERLPRCERLLAALFHRRIAGEDGSHLPWNWNSHFGHCGQSCPCCRWAVTQSTKGCDYFGTCAHCETARALRALPFRISQLRPTSHIDTAVLATRLSSSYQLDSFSDDIFESGAESD